MDDAPGWLPDPEREDQERYWNGSGWTDRVRPTSRTESLHLPEHVPELQRALAASTADIDSVEDRLSLLFDRTDPKHEAEGPDGDGAVVEGDEDELIDFREDALEIPDDDVEVAAAVVESDARGGARPSAGAGDEDDSLAELDAALADEVPEPSKQRRLFRRRS